MAAPLRPPTLGDANPNEVPKSFTADVTLEKALERPPKAPPFPLEPNNELRRPPACNTFPVESVLPAAGVVAVPFAGVVAAPLINPNSWENDPNDVAAPLRPSNDSTEPIAGLISASSTRDDPIDAMVDLNRAPQVVIFWPSNRFVNCVVRFWSIVLPMFENVLFTSPCSCCANFNWAFKSDTAATWAT
jgi:hypothetical protein